MSRLKKIQSQKIQRKSRVRSQVVGSVDRPRLSVHISNRNVTAQIINDDAMKTLVYVSSVGKKEHDGNMTELASQLGTELSKKAKTAKISKIVFDRGSKLYHGRVKALAEAAREGGLEF